MQVHGTPTAFGESTSDWPFALPLVPAEALRGSVRPALAGWRLLRRIGQGRRSSIWLAEDPRHGGEVALKLADAGVPAADAAAAFAREHALASRLRHPRVLRTLEHGRAGRVAYLAMEHVPGGDLAARLGQPHAPARALAWLREAAGALAQLHGCGLVHRDVKPANFLLRADASLVLADFGLVAAAGTADPLARPGAIVGTPCYVAPEQLQGAPAQPAADVYGLGVLLHELLCGAPPFGGETLMEVLSQHLVAVPPRLVGVPAPLQRLADAMLAKDPRARLPDAAAVLAQIESLEPLDSAAAGTTGNRW